MATCRLCERECEPSSSTAVLCRYHLAAKTNLESSYEQWRDAYGGMTMKEYLAKVAKNPQTGEWAREVAEFLSKQQGGE